MNHDIPNLIWIMVALLIVSIVAMTLVCRIVLKYWSKNEIATVVRCTKHRQQLGYIYQLTYEFNYSNVFGAPKKQVGTRMVRWEHEVRDLVAVRYWVLLPMVHRLFERTYR